MKKASMERSFLYGMIDKVIGDGKKTKRSTLVKRHKEACLILYTGGYDGRENDLIIDRLVKDAMRVYLNGNYYPQWFFVEDHPGYDYKPDHPDYCAS